jgi:hypothetical protein
LSNFYGVAGGGGGTSGPAGVGTSGPAGAGTVGTVGVGTVEVGARPLLTNHQVTRAKTKRTTTTIIIFLWFI